MPNFSSIRQSVAYALNTVDFGDSDSATVDKIICGVGLFKMVESISSADKSLSGQLNSLATSYVNSYVKSVQAMNGKYISYAYMKRKIEEWQLTNFLNITQTQLNTLYIFYTNKSEIAIFNTSYYKSEMYGIINTLYSSDAHLSKIHKYVMSPIANYYNNRYGIPSSAVHIYDALGEAMNPGKVIIFDINSVPEYMIVNDIKSGKILSIQQYIYNIETSDGHVKLITK